MAARGTLSPAEARFVAGQRVGHLATSDAAGAPHVVPVCYAWDGAAFWIALDEKPKRVPAARLKRARNIAARGEASLVVDRYDEDWSRLGFVLASGAARLVAPGAPGHAEALALLRARYPQYRAMALEELPMIALAPRTVTAWGAIEGTDGADGAAATLGAMIGSERASAAGDRAAGRGVDFLPLARGRRSVRRFTTEPVPRAVIEQVLEAARWAPSPHGRQPWRFAVLTRAAAKERLVAAMGAEWQRNLEMDQEPAGVVATRLEKSRERMLRAPALIIPCLYLAELDIYPDAERQAAEATMAVQSLGAAIQNLLLAAFALGLDGGWMCAPLFCPEVVRDALGLDDGLIPHALITLGYAAQDPVRRPRRPLGELIVYDE
ncbi:MAG TPA: TIGR03668 family PPOX class F420-dependent oxidoreductase [Ktedonobacterales bacterium]